MDGDDGRRAAATDECERGFVLVWVAAVLFVLLGVAAFAVDLVHAYVVAQQAQNAADAASLGGVVELGRDLDGSAARTRAFDLAANNGFTDGVDGAAVDPEQTGANELTVTVRRTVSTWFARALGISTLTVRRVGVAQYDAPLAMGSPANNLGDVPGDSCMDLGYPAGSAGTPAPCVGANFQANATQNLFAQIQGPDTGKGSGNSFTTNYCRAATDGCDFTGPGANNQYDPNGEYFFVHNDVAGADLTVALYDAGFVDTGPFCDLLFAGADPTRYFPSSSYCAGDRRQPGAAPDGFPLMDTRFELLAPDGDNDPTNNPRVCGPLDIDGEAPEGGTISAAALRYFQRWHVLCTVGGAGADPALGDYVLHVWSTLGHGTNQFSVLALHRLPAAPTDRLAVYTRQRLPLLVVKPVGGTPAEFYVARVLPSSRDRVLELEFFDLGDSPSSSSGTLRLVTENVTSGGTLRDCLYTHPPGTPPEGGAADPAPPWDAPGDLQPSASCTFSYDRTWNGQWVTVRVPIPRTYGCDTTRFENCWVKLQILPAGGSQLSDATTWNARMAGAPVRLVG